MLTKLHNWMADLAGKTVIWADGNAPAPPRPYFVLSMTGFNAVGHDEDRGVEWVEDAFIHETIGQRVVNVRLTCFAERGDPRAALSELIALQGIMRARRDDILKHGISILSDGAVTNVPQLVQSEYQPQAVLDLDVVFATSTKLGIGVIETVQGAGQINGSVTIHNEPFEVNVDGSSL